MMVGPNKGELASTSIEINKRGKCSQFCKKDRRDFIESDYSTSIGTKQIERKCLH